MLPAMLPVMLRVRLPAFRLGGSLYCGPIDGYKWRATICMAQKEGQHIRLGPKYWCTRPRA
eukprot:11224644-Lingulodinium_polyedra.AAC.1